MTLRTYLGLQRRRVNIFVRRPRLGVYTWITENPYSEMIYAQFRGADAPLAMTDLRELETFTKLPPDGRLAVGGCQPPCGCPHVLTPLSFVDLTLFLELLGLRLLGRFVQINDALMVDGEPPSAGQRFLILGERSDGK